MPRRVLALVVTAVILLAIAGGVVWTQVVKDGSRPVAWKDVTARMPGALWPKAVSRSFWKEEQLVRFLDRTFPEGGPKAPRFEFDRRRLILVSAGPRSSTGYGVRIVRITERHSTIDVLAKETTPTLDRPGASRLTSPYRLITIPATPKRVYVQWQGRP